MPDVWQGVAQVSLPCGWLLFCIFFCPDKPFSNNLSRKVPASIQNYDIAFEKEPEVLPNHQKFIENGAQIDPEGARRAPKCAPGPSWGPSRQQQAFRDRFWWRHGNFWAPFLDVFLQKNESTGAFRLDSLRKRATLSSYRPVRAD